MITDNQARKLMKYLQQEETLEVGGGVAPAVLPHHAVDTLAVQLTVPVAGPVEDSHLQVDARPTGPKKKKGRGHPRPFVPYPRHCGRRNGSSEWLRRASRLPEP